MRRRNKGNNKVVMILVLLIIIALVLMGVLVVLISRQNIKDGGNGMENVDYSTGENVFESADNNIGETGQANEDLPIIGQGGDRSPYRIEFQSERTISGSDVSRIADEIYDFEFDLDGDDFAEKYQVGFSYDAQTGTMEFNILEGGVKMDGAAFENKIESSDSIDVVTIKNNSGRGLGVICKTFDENDNKYVLQCIVWEYVDNVLTKQWDMVYTGRGNESNGYMKDGYIHGLIRGEQVDYATDSHMNGYILNRSTLMADMKNLGIKLPKDTTGECLISYGHYAAGIVRIVVD